MAFCPSMLTKVTNNCCKCANIVLSSLTGGWIMDGLMIPQKTAHGSKAFFAGCRSQDRRLSFLFNYD